MTIKTIAIIGGGPSGLGVAKAMGLEPDLDNVQIDLFERQDKLGGLWCYNAENKKRLLPAVPSTTPHSKEYVNPDFVSAGVANDYVSPMYSQLETNITHEIMQYNGYPFVEKKELFPARTQIQSYLASFANTIDKKVSIHLNHEILDLSKDESSNVWNLQIYDYNTNQKSVRVYDSVILAHGHFHSPYIPDVKGLSDWAEKDPESISHAKYFTQASDYRDKQILVVGNYASGVDISTQLSTTARKIYLSSREPTTDLAELKNPYVDEINLIEEYNYHDKSVTTVDGEKYTDIDIVIFCTGYLYTVPFLSSYLDDLLTPKGFQLKNLYQDIFFIKDPSLIFIGLPKLIIPMPFAESQGCLVSRYLSGRYRLPSVAEMNKWIEEKINETESEREYHNLKFPKDIEYCQLLQKYCDEVDKDGKGGHTAEVWSDERTKDRKDSGEIKKQRFSKILSHTLKLRENGEDFVLLRGK